MRVVAALVLMSLWAVPVAAQPKELLPPFVIDLRGLIVQLNDDLTTAGDIGLQGGQLPTTALGAAIGATFYPLRRQKISLGLGGEGLLSRAVTTVTDSTGAVVGPRVERRFQGISGIFSLNFGHRQGWSYISGGAGPVRFQTFTGDLPVGTIPFELTGNFGVGARWFTSEHVAFCFDLRLYFTQPVAATDTTPGRGKSRVLAISVGVSLK